MFLIVWTNYENQLGNENGKHNDMENGKQIRIWLVNFVSIKNFIGVFVTLVCQSDCQMEINEWRNVFLNIQMNGILIFETILLLIFRSFE